MPMMYVEPEILTTTHRGVTVYHDYDDGQVLTMHYQVQVDDFDSAYATFDVRDLAHKAGLRVPKFFSWGEMAKFIKAAEDAFDLPLDEVLRQNDLWSEGNG